MESIIMEYVIFGIIVLISQPIWNWYNNNYSRKRLQKESNLLKEEVIKKLDQVLIELQKSNKEESRQEQG